jgi:hypothetical protein
MAFQIWKIGTPARSAGRVSVIQFCTSAGLASLRDRYLARWFSGSVVAIR